jgi:hypothetical protein
MTTSQPNPEPSNQPTSPLRPSPRAMFFESTSLGRWCRRNHVAGLVGKKRRSLFDEVVGPLMTAYAEGYARIVVGQVEQKAERALREATQVGDRVKYFDEFVCPKCKEPRHPKSASCWKCTHDAMVKVYDDNMRLNLKLRQCIRSQRVLVNLAMGVLGRSARQKKKGPFVRQAHAILEAALAEPEPGESSHLWATALAASGILAFAAYMGVGAYARSKMGAWGSTADAGPPPTAEELSKSP